MWALHTLLGYWEVEPDQEKAVTGRMIWQRIFQPLNSSLHYLLPGCHDMKAFLCQVLPMLFQGKVLKTTRAIQGDFMCINC